MCSVYNWAEGELNSCQQDNSVLGEQAGAMAGRQPDLAEWMAAQQRQFQASNTQRTQPLLLF